MIVVCPGLLQNDASSSNFGNRFKSPSHEKAWQLDVKGKKNKNIFLANRSTLINLIN